MMYKCLRIWFMLFISNLYEKNNIYFLKIMLLYSKRYNWKITQNGRWGSLSRGREATERHERSEYSRRENDANKSEHFRRAGIEKTKDHRKNKTMIDIAVKDKRYIKAHVRQSLRGRGDVNANEWAFLRGATWCESGRGAFSAARRKCVAKR